ncbi:MerR family DNA-binding transcriptional regulator [Corynebacterium meridianum]|uniref:MerR family DNA-binding transcriptional regulator n=1 Tax=Corynebacterium meridianum TaxID=2765363 RepID=A0A934M7P8_9CORY|nr:MerR family DNA-binding transcriptional regulator [Corynebacterium meridianum]
MNNSRGLRIGVFSQLTGISVRMLRYYGTHRVLIPAATDPATGYRFSPPTRYRRHRSSPGCAMQVSRSATSGRFSIPGGTRTSPPH